MIDSTLEAKKDLAKILEQDHKCEPMGFFERAELAYRLDKYSKEFDEAHRAYQLSGSAEDLNKMLKTINTIIGEK